VSLQIKKKRRKSNTRREVLGGSWFRKPCFGKAAEGFITRAVLAGGYGEGEALSKTRKPSKCGVEKRGLRYAGGADEQRKGEI